MTPAGLREVLHQVASAGVGPHTSTRVVALATGARAAERRRRRGTWTVAVAVAGVAMLLVSLAFAAVTVTNTSMEPADGPGSLPNQVYPSRERVLSIQQAPIGRVALAYSGPLVDGRTSWMAVGADSDNYRVVAQGGGGEEVPGTIDVSSDGTTVAVARGGERSAEFRVDLVSALSGETDRVQLPDRGLGGEVSVVRWSPDGRTLVVDALVVTEREGDGWTARRALFFVDVPEGGRPTAAQLDAGDAEVGDSGIVGVDAVGRAVLLDRSRGSARLLVAGPDGVSRGPVVDARVRGESPWSLSPDGQRLAGLLAPNADDRAGVTEERVLAVWSVADGTVLSRTQLGPVGFATEVVGWRDSTTPVLSELRGPPTGDGATSPSDYVGQLAAYPLGGRVEVLTVFSLGGGNSLYGTARLAADVLTGGQVREAGPPHQPWYDPRTLGPWLWDRWSWLVLAGVVLAVAVAAVSVMRGRAQVGPQPPPGP